MKKLSKKDLQLQADKLFKDGYQKLFATDEGWFFTEKANAEANAKTTGSQVFEFKADGTQDEDLTDLYPDTTTGDLLPDQGSVADPEPEPVADPEPEPVADPEPEFTPDPGHETEQAPKTVVIKKVVKKNASKTK